MKVFTPGQLSEFTGSKYLGVLVAAKYARRLNDFRRGQVADDDVYQAPREKLTTTALYEVISGELPFKLTPRNGPGDI